MPAIRPVNKSSALEEDVAEEIYASLLSAYGQHGESLEVDFRNLIPGVASADRATHLLHSYPAKLLRHIPALIVASPQISPRESLILDPFCGSGTTLVESFLAGRSAIGIDVNPLAVLVSKVKTTTLDVDKARRELAGVIKRARAAKETGHSYADRLDYWYHEKQLSGLCRLRDAIRQVENRDIRDALNVALSSTAREVSLANPRISVPVRLKPEAYPEGHVLRRRLTDRLERIQCADPLSTFESTAEKTLESIDRLESFDVGQSVSVRRGDARTPQLPSGGAKQVDLILTSPPYLSAQKYIRATSLNLLCLEIADSDELKRLQGLSIGREFFRKAEYAESRETGVADADKVIDECRETNTLRAHLATEYLLDMRDALVGMASLLRTGGALVLIVGGNQLCDKQFNTPAYLRYLCEEIGLSLELQLTDTIRSRGLMTRRNREASPIATERVLVFRK